MEATKKRAFKDRIYDEFARIAKALAHRHRIELIELLAQAERSVEELAAELGLPIANISQHLQVLRSVHMVAFRRQGTYNFYRLAESGVFEIWRALRGFGERQVAEVDRIVNTYLDAPDLLEPIDAEELSERLREGETIVLDVRPVNEFDAGHIDGAISIPINDLERRLQELPRNREIVAYCRGPYCVYAHDAVRDLSARGYKARRLAIGLPDWRALGLPVVATVPRRERSEARPRIQRSRARGR